jgi:hypothetical protein
MSPEPAARFVAYYRVSTDRQGKSGLGLEGNDFRTHQSGLTGSQATGDKVGEIQNYARPQNGPSMWLKPAQISLLPTSCQ